MEYFNRSYQSNRIRWKGAVMGKEKRDKKAEFKENPDKFIHVDDIVIAVTSEDDYLIPMVNLKHGFAVADALGRITCEVIPAIQYYKIQVQQAQASKIIKPSNGGVNRMNP